MAIKPVFSKGNETSGSGVGKSGSGNDLSGSSIGNSGSNVESSGSGSENTGVVKSSVAMIPREEAEAMVMKASEIAVERALASKVGTESRKEDDSNTFGLGDKLVKQLQGTVQVFNTLKDFASNPLQRAIEEKIGVLAADQINRVFTPPIPQSTDIIDKVLNSQLAAGLGAGLGQRGPELYDKILGTFGKEKTEEWIGGVISGKKGLGGGNSGMSGMGHSGMGGMGHSGSGGGNSGSDMERGGMERGGGEGQSDIELITQLDPNNPEHITAYAQSQGGIPHDIARKMLMVHQDALIKQMELRGVNNNNVNNVQNYRAPTPTSVSPNYSFRNEQDLNEKDQKIDDDLRAKQIEPDALIPTDVGNGIEYVESAEVQEQQSDNADNNVSNSLNNSVSNSVNASMDNNVNASVDNSVNSYLKTLTDAIMELKNTVDMQNHTINDLKNDVDIINTKRTNEDLDKEIFGGVRKDERDKNDIITESDIIDDKKYPKGSMGWLKQQNEKKS